MGKLNRFDVSIRFRRGLAEKINSTATVNTAQVGEPHYTTDGKKLYVFDGTINRRIHGNDMVLVFGGEVLTSNGEILWKGEYL